MKRSFFVVVFFLLSLSGCLGTSEEGVNPFLLIFSSDYSTGELGVTSLDPPWMRSSVAVSGLTTDVLSRSFDGKVYLVNRFGGDKIQILDPANDFALDFEFSTGQNSNPHDIAFASSTKAYITRYDTANLWIADLSAAPGELLREIDLSAFADDDELPEMSRMVIVGNRLYVAIQRYDLTVFSPAGESFVAVIDTTEDTLVDQIALVGTNPSTDLIALSDGRIAVGNTGAYGALDGGVEIVNPTSGESEGFLVTEEELGGDILHLAMKSSSSGYAVVDGIAASSLKFFDGSGVETVFETTPYGVGPVVLDLEGGRVLLCDRTPGDFGVRVFSTEDGTESADSPISSGDLPPAYLLVAR